MENVHLCLSDLLDQNMTANEYFQTLSPELQSALRNRDITTFEELQAVVKLLEQSPFRS